ncbi:MAG: hypothetical protein LH479_08610 [Polaromonas sp.]|nr:hypothetical protein [Polaromonas sp.]
MWNAASQTSITLEDVHRASALTMASMDENFFKVRLDRTTPAEKRYLRGMAELRARPYRSGDIAA